jgi:hypothetical protein
MAIKVDWNPVNASGFTQGGMLLGQGLANAPKAAQEMIMNRLKASDLRHQQELKLKQEGFFQQLDPTFDMNSTEGMLGIAEKAQQAGLPELSMKLRTQAIEKQKADAASMSAEKPSGLDAVLNRLQTQFGLEKGYDMWLKGLQAQQYNRPVVPGTQQSKPSQVDYTFITNQLKDDKTYQGLSGKDPRRYAIAITKRIRQLQTAAANSKTGEVPEDSALFAQAQAELAPYMEPGALSNIPLAGGILGETLGASIKFNQDQYNADRLALKSMSPNQKQWVAAAQEANPDMSIREILANGREKGRIK